LDKALSVEKIMKSLFYTKFIRNHLGKDFTQLMTVNPDLNTSTNKNKTVPNDKKENTIFENSSNNGILFNKYANENIVPDIKLVKNQNYMPIDK
jgi:hypothetical protein